MDRRIYDGENTVCQTLRDMYHLTEDQGIRLKCRVAMSMAKAMCRKMMEYRDEFGPTTGPEFQDGI